jgi:hypothetical protein
MKPLDLESRRLIDDANAADLPAPDAQAKLWESLSQRIGQPLPPTAAAAQHALGAGAKLGLLSGVSAKLLIGAGLLGAVASSYGVYTLAHKPTAESAQPAPLAPRPAPASEARPPGEARPNQALAPAPAPVEVASSLLEETRLLASAQRALSAGAAAKALLLIDQHRARFPQGALAQERDAARVLALCALGRRADAQRERHAFLHTWPDSPLSARVRAGCSAAQRTR